MRSLSAAKAVQWASPRVPASWTVQLHARAEQAGLSCLKRNARAARAKGPVARGSAGLRIGNLLPRAKEHAYRSTTPRNAIER